MSLFNRSFVRLAPSQWVTKRYYKLSVGSIKKGQVVQLKEKAWKVLTRDHVSSGRGGAVVKVITISPKKKGGGRGGGEGLTVLK